MFLDKLLFELFRFLGAVQSARVSSTALSPVKLLMGGQRFVIKKEEVMWLIREFYWVGSGRQRIWVADKWE